MLEKMFDENIWTISGGLVAMFLVMFWVFMLIMVIDYNRTIVVQDLPQDVIEKQKKAILEARKPGKEDTVWISSDSEGELNEVKLVNIQMTNLLEGLGGLELLLITE